MKNYCYIYLLAACMAPMSLQAKKAIPYSGEVCIAPLPTVPTPLAFVILFCFGPRYSAVSSAGAASSTASVSYTHLSST